MGATKQWQLEQVEREQHIENREPAHLELAAISFSVSDSRFLPRLDELQAGEFFISWEDYQVVAQRGDSSAYGRLTCGLCICNGDISDCGNVEFIRIVTGKPERMQHDTLVVPVHLIADALAVESYACEL